MESVPLSRLPVAVVGGGVAGISAAFHLSRYGLPTILFERSDRLGGRICSFFDHDFGTQLDLGPHVVAGAYRDFLALLRGFGTEGDLRWIRPLHLPFKGIGTPVYHLRFWTLPSIFSPLGGLLSYGALPFWQRLSLAAQFMRLTSMRRVPALSAEAWLKGIGATPAQMSRFWQPLSLATLNASPARVSIIGVQQIARLGLAQPGGFALGVPSKPWQEIVGNAALSYLRQRGVEVRLRAQVRGIVIEDNQACSLFVDGERLEVSALILAVSPWDWKQVLTARQFELLFDKAWLAPPSSAIHGVHFLFDEPPTAARMFGLLGTTNHWVFARRLEGAEASWLVSTAVSDSSRLFRDTADDLISLTFRELREIWPDFKGQPRKSTCMRTRWGTCPFGADLEEHRPDQRTGVMGLFLASDATATGLPATLESAARAGLRAVEALCEGRAEGGP